MGDGSRTGSNFSSALCLSVSAVKNVHKRKGVPKHPLIILQAEKCRSSACGKFGHVEGVSFVRTVSEGRHIL